MKNHRLTFFSAKLDVSIIHVASEEVSVLTIRKAADRGHFDYGWLDTHHTFSFSGYHDPRHVHYRTLRVINEDVVQPGQGFVTHPHDDMEILTYVLSGELAHRDSTGGLGTIRPGELQHMTAGTGLTHSEFNASRTDPVHLYQIWIFPERKGLTPSYGQKRFDPAERRNRLQLVASRDGADGSLTIRQDARIYLADLEAGATLEHESDPDRGLWIQVLRGGIELNGASATAGDGIAIESEAAIALRAKGPAEVMVFDLA